jgi:mono/diheme cytochrome c family protein
MQWPQRALGIALLVLAGCGRPDPGDRPKRPSQVKDFGRLFGENCAGCHGAEGKDGPAPPLNDPLFLALIKDAELRRIVRGGRPGFLMPAFARTAGGRLTDEQIEIVVRGIRGHWGRPPPQRHAPPYSSGDERGDPAAGAKLFKQACAGCHGTNGKGADPGGRLNDPAFLELLSDQALRRFIITGRPNLGMPNFAGEDGRSPDFRPLRSRQVADLVALLASWREKGP